MNYAFFKIILLILLVFPLKGFSQCNDELIDRAMVKIKDTKYLKTFKVVLKKGKGKHIPSRRYLVKMNKGSVYKFVIENDEANKSPLILRISDDLKVYGQTYDPVNDVDYMSFEFYCRRTQNYYITAFYKDGKKGCGVAIMSLMGFHNLLPSQSMQMINNP